MRERKAARLLVISPAKQVLLFRFEHKDGALAGRNYWATPGGHCAPPRTRYGRRRCWKCLCRRMCSPPTLFSDWPEFCRSRAPLHSPSPGY